MDFLDPEKQRTHMIRLLAGYVLIAVAILIGTMILLYQAFGFGLGKDGEVIQNGLVFVSTAPSPARVYLNGERYRDDTNTKLQLAEGHYRIELQREGYHTWERDITVQGGSVQHFDYPKMIPAQLTTTTLKPYAEAPGFASQSPDRRWLVVQQGSAPLAFDVFDLSNPEEVTASVETISVPEAVVTSPRAVGHGWKLVEWSTDNRHLLLQHTYGTDGAASEYIMLNRQTPEESVNLTRTLQLSPTMQLSLRDKKFDRYFLYDAAARTLGTTTNDGGQITPLLDNVISFKTYGSDVVLYMTDRESASLEPLAGGKVLSMLRDGDQTYRIREHVAGAPYLVDLAKYSGDWFVAAGSRAESKVYVYKNPQRIRKASRTAALVPVNIMRVTQPDYIQFSSNTQFIMIEQGPSFGQYDAENDKRYTYTAKAPLDPPAAHATWMDGHRLTYVSGGKVQIFDYDNTNARSLSPASPNYLPFFDRDYEYLYTLAPIAGGSGMNLTATSLLTPEDR